MQAKKEDRRHESTSSKPLLSHSTILILSAFLVGIAAGKAPNAKIEVMLYLTSICGVIAYFCLGRLARKRRRRAEQREQQYAAQQLEMRVGRHIPQPSHSTGRTRVSNHTNDDQPQLDTNRQRQPVGFSQ